MVPQVRRKQAKVSDQEHVFERRTDSDDIGYKLCKCCKCGETSRCTPRNDFYTAGEDKDLRSTPQGAPLWCEPCLMNKNFGTPNPPTLIMDGGKRAPGDEIVVKGGGRRRKAVITDVDEEGNVKSFDMMD